MGKKFKTKAQTKNYEWKTIKIVCELKYKLCRREEYICQSKSIKQ